MAIPHTSFFLANSFLTTVSCGAIPLSFKTVTLTRHLKQAPHTGFVWGTEVLLIDMIDRNSLRIRSFLEHQIIDPGERLA